MSALEGRHPEFAKAEREKAEAMERRRRELEMAEARARKQMRRRLVIGGTLVVVLGTGGLVARHLYEARVAVVRSADAFAKSFTALGFQEVAPPPWGTPDRLEVPVAAGTCVVALGTADGAPTLIEVTHDGDTLEAKGSLGFCTCANETVIVAAKGAADAKRSVRLLRTDAREFGSVMGFDRAPVKPASVVACACLEDQLDGWMAGGSANATLRPAEPEWTKSIAGASELASAGLAHVATTSRGVPIFPLSVPAETCAVAIPEAAAKLALRATGGNKVVPADRGPLAVCTKVPRVFGVWHEGAGPVHVVRGEAARVGGRHELRTLLAHSGFGIGRVWVEMPDLAGDAELTLRRARVAPAYSMEWAPKVKLPSDARILLFSDEGASSIDPPATSTGEAACERSDSLAPTLFCVETSRQPWNDATGKARAVVAYASLPPWLKPLADIQGHEAATAALSLVTLTRKLAAAGFEPTPLEGITETASGADVLGRAGEDAVVAVTVQPHPPYLLPLTDGPTWRVDGPPRVIDLAPGRRVSLRSRPAPGGDEDDRRTLVYRRSTKTK